MKMRFKIKVVYIIFYAIAGVIQIELNNLYTITITS
jgi:hypothetical protein